ncbi:DUF4097 family beta strand repeat-containing protein [Agromyces bauzanensis]|uniref:DUF4097 domain-containing protein n=1 Tax=Agromyces bauzanensis TaxID=1308924 RepID=A0A917UWQ8_9MICO|nr:DUF4097 family beta strand repeat-containing protein [Agromyces bauzanensis]GGJ91147.1 hypothetical protein GCM10011372_31980 [Agromyces bauzanensis]
MNRFVRAAAAVAVTAMTVGGLAACNFIGPPQRFTDESTVTEDIAVIELDDANGSVRVTGAAGATDITVERTVSYLGDRDIGETHEIDGDTLELGGCGRFCSVDYTVEGPIGLDVGGRTSNGTIELRGVDEVDVRTSNGRIELEDVSGDVDVETSNGRVIGRDLNGDGVRVRTSNGSIELSLGEAQDVEARTSNGAIELRVPEGSYRVTAETSNGSTDIGIADDPDGEFELELRTSNGSITITGG